MAAARVVHAEYATLIGTPQRVAELLGIVSNAAAAVVHMEWANVLLLDQPPTGEDIRRAIETTPKGTTKGTKGTK